MELLNTLKQFNWLDILVIIILIRILYVAIKNGFSVELFKLFGTIFSVYLSMHYYIIISNYIGSRIGAKKVLLELLATLCFIVLAILAYLIFMLLRTVFSRFIKLEAAPKLNKWGGFIFGMVRGVLLISLIIFIFVISPFGYLKNSVNNAYSAKPLFKVASNTYSWLWNSITSKFMTQEKFNKTVLEVQQSLTQK